MKRRLVADHCCKFYMDIITCNLQIVGQALNSEISGGCWYFMDV